MIVVVVVTWLAAFLCAHQLARIAGVTTTIARSVCATVIAFALLAVVPGQLCRVVGNFDVSITIALVLFAAIAFALRRIRTSEDGTLPAFVAPHWIAYVVGVVAFVCVVDGALTRNFFDEDHHVPMLTVIARGVVPPQHPLDPGETIPYHWGIDALYAQLFSGGLRPDTAIDVVTILCWPLLFLVAAWFGGALRGRVGATVGAIVTPLAGSPFAWPLHDDMGILQLPQPWPDAWHQWDRRPPPITADFFQHPHGLAFPIVLVVLLLFAFARNRRTLAVAAVLLGCLSLVQAIHFLVVGFALTASALATFARDRNARVVVERGTALAGALALAIAFGGFFAIGAPTASTLAWGHSFFADTSIVERVLHHLAAFGLPLALLPFAKPSSHEMRVALIAGAAIGFFLPNVVVYASSWDIVKFYSAGAFLAGAACSDTIARFINADWKRTTALAVAAALTIWFPIAWMASRTVMQGHLGVPDKHDFRLRDDVLEAGRVFSPLVPSSARVLTGDPEIGRQNGFLTPGFDARRYLPFHMVDYAEARRLITAHDVAMKTLDRSSLAALDVDYAIITRNEAARFPQVQAIATTPKYALLKLPRSQEPAPASSSAP